MSCWFAAGEENFANVTAEEGITGEWLDDVARGTEFIALFDYLNDDLGARGLLNGSLIREGHEKADLTDFLRQIPTAWNQAEMKRVQHADRGRRWTPNDHYDINPYSVALTYCDALAADKHWADKIRRADLAAINDCDVMTTADELRLYLLSSV